METRIPLPLNLDLQFRVEQTQPQVILKLLPQEIPENQKFLSLLKNYLSVDVPLESLAEKLSALARMEPKSVSSSIQKSLEKFLQVFRQKPSTKGGKK